MSLYDTDLYDEDTDTFYSDASCYCKHGTYIGTPGGPDLMCGACECGDPDPTPAELRRSIARYEQRLVERTLELEAIFHDHGLALTPDEARVLTRDERVGLRNCRPALAEALRWAEHEDDDNWLSRRFYAEMRGAA